MPYIGNTVQNQGFTPAIDYFSGNGVTVTFTLSRPLVSVAQIICAIDNVIQNPSSAYTISGNQITFTSAPLAGTNNIWVEYTSLITTYAAISQSPSVIGDITASGGYLAVGNFNNTFLDGTIVDYVTGNGRITVGPADGLTIYNGGTSARTALAAWGTTGHLTNTGAVASNGGPTSGNSLVAGRVDSSSEGGQLDLCRSTDNVSAWAIDVYGSTSTPSLRFIDNIAGAARMQIDSSGYVTKPYQVAFYAYNNQSNPSIGNSYVQITLNATKYNIGNGFNTGTSTFTAPIAGRYLLMAKVNAYSTPGVIRAWITVNGSKDYTGVGFSGNTGGDNDTTAHVILQLAAGDAITLFIYTGNGGNISSGQTWNWLSGYLLG